VADDLQPADPARTATTRRALDQVSAAVAVCHEPGRANYPDPWHDPGYPLAAQAALGLPEPARQCRRWLAGDGQCIHPATAEITIGCRNEHVTSAELCACCAERAVGATGPHCCGICRVPAVLAAVRPLYPLDDRLIG
jgi:hypothetical protein